jgi:hypothetical protein
MLAQQNRGEAAHRPCFVEILRFSSDTRVMETETNFGARSEMSAADFDVLKPSQKSSGLQDRPVLASK